MAFRARRYINAWLQKKDITVRVMVKGVCVAGILQKMSGIIRLFITCLKRKKVISDNLTPRVIPLRLSTPLSLSTVAVGSNFSGGVVERSWPALAWRVAVGKGLRRSVATRSAGGGSGED